MNTEYEKRTFTNREFVAMVRRELAAAGRTDVTIERGWIDEDEPGYSFLLHVPVGPELTVPLRAKELLVDARSVEDKTRHAREFAKALINLRSAEATLTKYARDVRRSANAVIKHARSEGLDVLVDRIGFKPTYAFHLTLTSWKEAALNVLAEVTIRHTSFFLRPKTSVIHVEEPDDVAREIGDLFKEQRERQSRVAELDAQGYDLLVDGVTLDLLKAHGLDAGETLKRVWKEQCVNLRVRYGDRDVHLSLISSDGIATASIDLPGEGFWNGEHMWLWGEQHHKDHKGLIGKSLGDLVTHPAFTSRPIVDIFHRHADHFVFDLSGKFMFDADTGRIWREERLAA